MSLKMHLTSRCIRFIVTPYLNKLHKLAQPLPLLNDLCYNSQTLFFGTNQVSKLPQTPKIVLTPRIVIPTLLNCPSDLMALSFFFWCAKQPNYFHDMHAFNHMVTVVYRLTQRFETVKRILCELERIGCVTRAQNFLLLMRIYWHGGMYGFVLEAFEEMGSFGCTPNTFARNMIMDVLFKIGHVNVALRVLSETPIPNFLTFNIALHNLCKLKELPNVRNVLRIMLRERYHLNVETFSEALNCFCKLGKLAEAFQALGMMITYGIPLSVGIWSLLIDTFCKSRQFSMAGYLLEKMVEAGCSPNVVTYTSLIKGYFESQMFSKASVVLSSMKSKGCTPDLVLYNVLIHCLSKNGRHDEAIDLFCGLSRRELVPNLYTFSSLLSAICTSRKFSLLPKVISRFGIQADLVVCNLLLCYFVKARFPLQAVEFYNHMLDRGFVPDKYTFIGLLHGLCGAGRIDEAVNVYHGIIMSHSGIDAHIHTVIINELIKVGKFHRAINLFRKAVTEKYPLDVVSYTVAIHGLFKGGRIEEACALYGQMKEAGISPNERTYNLMLSGFCTEEDFNMVKWILGEMIKSRIEMYCNTFEKMSNFLFRTPNSHSISFLLSEMRSLGLICT